LQEIYFFSIPQLWGAGNPSYPRDFGVFTTLEKTVIPVPVPLNSPNLLPYQVVNFSLYGYGVWQYGGGLEYEKDWTLCHLHIPVYHLSILQQ